MPEPVAAPTNKLFPMHYSGPRFYIPCMAGLRFPALVVKMCFSGPSGQSPLFCRIQPVQMHHPHLRRPLMHAAHLIPRIQMRSESDEAHHYLVCSPRTLIEAWALECVLYNSSQLRSLQGYSCETREKAILTQMGCAGSAWFDSDMSCPGVTPRAVFKNTWASAP